MLSGSCLISAKKRLPMIEIDRVHVSGEAVKSGKLTTDCDLLMHALQIVTGKWVGSSKKRQNSSY